jgi:hypothetical protein
MKTSFKLRVGVVDSWILLYVHDHPAIREFSADISDLAVKRRREGNVEADSEGALRR